MDEVVTAEEVESLSLKLRVRLDRPLEEANVRSVTVDVKLRSRSVSGKYISSSIFLLILDFFCVFQGRGILSYL